MVRERYCESNVKNVLSISIGIENNVLKQLYNVKGQCQEQPKNRAMQKCIGKKTSDKKKISFVVLTLFVYKTCTSKDIERFYPTKRFLLLI